MVINTPRTSETYQRNFLLLNKWIIIVLIVQFKKAFHFHVCYQGFNTENIAKISDMWIPIVFFKHQVPVFSGKCQFSHNKLTKHNIIPGDDNISIIHPNYKNGNT